MTPTGKPITGPRKPPSPWGPSAPGWPPKGPRPAK